MNLVAARRVDGAIVGWIGLGSDDRGVGDWDFGYITHPHHRGRGYATEALTAAIGYCLDTIGITAVWGQCDPANLASAAVMTRAGMLEIEATTRHRRFRITRDPSMR